MFHFNPPENIRKCLVFWCFQGDQKVTLGRYGLKLVWNFDGVVLKISVVHKFQWQGESLKSQPITYYAITMARKVSVFRVILVQMRENTGQNNSKYAEYLTHRNNNK